MYAHVCACKHAPTHAHTYVCMRMCMCAYVYDHICVSMCPYTHACVHVQRHLTDTETNRRKSLQEIQETFALLLLLRTFMSPAPSELTQACRCNRYTRSADELTKPHRALPPPPSWLLLYIFGHRSSAHLLDVAWLIYPPLPAASSSLPFPFGTLWTAEYSDLERSHWGYCATSLSLLHMPKL